MKIKLFVSGAEIDATELNDCIDRIQPRPTQPFSLHILDFLEGLSKRLSQHPKARVYPEILALAFWIRPASIERLRRDFQKLQDDKSILVPRGLVFHIPPANVDTIFIYSWVMSMVVGNGNLIRLPSDITPQLDALLSVVAKCVGELAQDNVLKRSIECVSYDHNRDVTTAISARCDVRVIWGGDRTVSTIRGIPLSARAVELVFPDRYSYCVVAAKAYNTLNDKEQKSVAQDFFNDAYWFDQTGCASPRILCWSGNKNDCSRASNVFWKLLRQTIRHSSYQTELGQSLRKLGFSYGSALKADVTSITRHMPELDVVAVDDLTDISRTHCGGGLFYEAFIDSLAELTQYVELKDQTLTHFGFDLEEIRSFARELNGRGVDRFVPIGKALEFGRYWDGYDLLQAFSKRVSY
ncbi:MAG: gamma-glutamyl phosphate reductase [Gammaproteobacteria bacterium]|nr:gamma-glutamyl phosphate reductase [Gammaproteobacteria bacterium]